MILLVRVFERAAESVMVKIGSQERNGSECILSINIRTRGTLGQDRARTTRVRARQESASACYGLTDVRRLDAPAAVTPAPAR